MKKNLLKELSLQGYKTFASKTTFEFPGRVTAIVGPNGSGKSNIADSIRWVLGEQAYSLLRGKKTTDMIFFGSEHRSRASMASASITFDNVSGWLPIDFSEVVITRRAYRSGENEYLLNDQKVRLKDIDELLANSGLGKRTYTIIGQGLVDNALSQRPEDRRSLFEEAAGIGLYKGRREESINKLDKTLQNMVRVTDILKEIKPRLGKLEKSLEKTRQYELVHADLEQSLKTYYGFLLHQARKEVADTKEFYQSQKSTLTQKKLEQDKVEEKVLGIQETINSNREKIAISHQELAEKHKKEEELNRSIAILEERLKSLERQNQDLISSQSALESKYERGLEVSREYEEKISSYKSNREELLISLDHINKKLQSEKTQNQLLEDQLEDLLNRKREIETNILLISPNEKALSNSIDRNQSEIHLIEQNIKQKNQEINQTKESLAAQEKKIEDFEKGLDITQKELLEYENILAKNKIQENQLSENIVNLKREISQIDAKITVIEEEEKQSKSTSGANFVLSKFDSNGNRQNLFPLIQILQVEPKYERAIAAALGNQLNGIVVPNSIEIIEIVKFIRDKQARRTVLISKEWNMDDDDQIKLPDDTFLASEIIRNSDFAGGVIERLLKKTIISENIEKAVNLIEFLKPGWNIVTEEGDLIDPNGFVVSGVEKQSDGLHRKRKKKEYESRKLLILSDIESYAKEISKLVEESDRYEGKITHQKNEISDLERKLRECNLMVYKLKIAHEQFLTDLNEIENKRQGLININAETRLEIEANQETAEQLKQNLLKLTQDIESIEPKIDRTKLNEFQVKSVDVSSQLAILAQVLKQQKENYENHLAQIEDLNSQRIELRKRFELVNEEIQLNQEKLSRNKTESQDIRKRIREQNALLRPIEEEVDQIIGAQGNVLNELEAMRREYSVAERHTLQAQMRFEKARDKLESVRMKIQDDLGFLKPADNPSIPDDAPLPFEELLANIPEVKILPDDLEEEINRQKALIRRIGPINPDVKMEYKDTNERVAFLEKQLEDLNQAERDLRKIVDELDEIMKKEFLKTFNEVQTEFMLIFEQLFNGGKAELFIANPEDIFNSGIEIEATLPGKRKQELGLLSGGERSLAAVALIFALLRISPTPFCVLDEVDAMLDESNVARFGELLRELSEFTQFIVITHNRNTVQLADVLYGITIGKDSVSQVISLKFDELTEEMVA